MTERLSEAGNCPECGASFKGVAIPEKDREFFGGKTNFTRLGGVYDLDTDQVTGWQCPECLHRWPRAALDQEEGQND